MAGAKDSLEQALLMSPVPLPLPKAPLGMPHWQPLTTHVHHGLPVGCLRNGSTTAQLCLPPGIRTEPQCGQTSPCNVGGRPAGVAPLLCRQWRFCPAEGAARSSCVQQSLLAWDSPSLHTIDLRQHLLKCDGDPVQQAVAVMSAPPCAQQGSPVSTMPPPTAAAPAPPCAQQGSPVSTMHPPTAAAAAPPCAQQGSPVSTMHPPTAAAAAPPCAQQGSPVSTMHPPTAAAAAPP